MVIICNERETKRVEIFKDAEAIYSFGCYYHNGERGFRQDDAKALELWLQAGELGHATSNSEVGDTYYNGRGVGRNIKKARDMRFCNRGLLIAQGRL